jgi:hypothetical protein
VYPVSALATRDVDPAVPAVPLAFRSGRPGPRVQCRRWPAASLGARRAPGNRAGAKLSAVCDRKTGKAILAASLERVIRVSRATTGASVRLACVVHTHPYSPRYRAPSEGAKRGYEVRHCLSTRRPRECSQRKTLLQQALEFALVERSNLRWSQSGEPLVPACRICCLGIPRPSPHRTRTRTRSRGTEQRTLAHNGVSWFLAVAPTGAVGGFQHRIFDLNFRACASPLILLHFWSSNLMPPALQRVVRLTSWAEEERTRPVLRYWLSRPAAERIAAVEYLRRQIDGAGARLRRVYRVLDCPWR